MSKDQKLKIVVLALALFMLMVMAKEGLSQPPNSGWNSPLDGVESDDDDDGDDGDDDDDSGGPINPENPVPLDTWIGLLIAAGATVGAVYATKMEKDGTGN